MKARFNASNPSAAHSGKITKGGKRKLDEMDKEIGSGSIGVSTGDFGEDLDELSSLQQQQQQQFSSMSMNGGATNGQANNNVRGGVVINRHPKQQQSQHINSSKMSVSLSPRDQHKAITVPASQASLSIPASHSTPSSSSFSSSVSYATAPIPSGSMVSVAAESAAQEADALALAGDGASLSVGALAASSKPERLKRPPNAYLLFNRDMRHRLLEKNPNMTVAEISKEIGEQWRLLQKVGGCACV